jgi:hypothetical protein
MLSSAESAFSFPEVIHLFFCSLSAHAFARILSRQLWFGFVIDNSEAITS